MKFKKYFPQIFSILTIFLIWRLGLFFIAFFAVSFFPEFGNRFPYTDQVLRVTGLPSWVWGFGNFDGVHYLRIAQDGYKAEFSQAFFPLYPALINIFNIFPKNPNLDIRTFVDPSYFLTGFILSNIFFLGFLLFFYKLIRIDFSQKIAISSLVLLLAFPTSFYFGSIYTESLFLFLATGALYFMRKNNFLIAGIFIFLTSAVRIFGLLLIPALIVEIYLKFKEEKSLKSKEFIKALGGILISPLGTLLYMLYLKLNFNDALYFLTSQPIFGAERTSGQVILLPQVIYRYLKIFITVPLQSQLFFNALMEFVFTAISVIVVLLFFKKMRLSYFIFTLGCLILPTFTGTLSSMPRYVLMSFLILPFIVSSGRYLKLLLISFIILQVVFLSLFIRGYWVA